MIYTSDKILALYLQNNFRYYSVQYYVSNPIIQFICIRREKCIFEEADNEPVQEKATDGNAREGNTISYL